MEIKFTLIACAVIAIASSLLTYNYTSNHYEAVIANEQARVYSELQKRTDKVLEKERANEQIVQVLNAKALEQSKELLVAKTNLDKLYSERGRMRVAAKCDSQPTGTPDSTPGNSEAGSSDATTGNAELSAEFSTFLAKLAYDADDMRSRLLICKEYAEAIDKQREEMYNDQ